MLTSGVPLIDVRAPVEYLRGAFPQAVNLPLLNDDERHQIGLRYKEAGQDKAIERGAELLDGKPREDRTETWRQYAQRHPEGAIYCFRGGLRSRIAQAWLAEAGIDWPLVTGGYKALRNVCLDALDRVPLSLPFVVVGGRTGSGKTNLLLQLKEHIDLEGLANHRGSSFGGMASEQPSPIDFENALAIELLRLDSMTDIAAVWLEDEAKLIGRRCLPDGFHAVMKRAPAVVLETPIEQRVATCTGDYVVNLLARYETALGVVDGFDAYADHHRKSLDRIRKRFGGERHAAALQLLETALAQHRDHADISAYVPFIELLLTEYYDPMYDYQLASKDREVLATGTAVELLDFAADYRATERESHISA